MPSLAGRHPRIDKADAPTGCGKARKAETQVVKRRFTDVRTGFFGPG